jgi:hypothetical protein
MGYRVFASHSEPDRAIVHAIRDATRPFGITVYSYDQDPQAGESLREKLLYEIEESDVLVAILTRASISSPVVNQEIGAAVNDGKRVIPIVEKGVRTDRFSFLDGIEPEILDPEHPHRTVARITNRLIKLKRRSDLFDVVTLAVVTGIGAWFKKSGSRVPHQINR